MKILCLRGMNFHAVVVFVTNFLLLLRLAVTGDGFKLKLLVGDFGHLCTVYIMITPFSTCAEWRSKGCQVVER